MCGRMTLTSSDLREVAELLDATVDAASLERFRPRYNVAPTDLHWVLAIDAHGERRVRPAVWGLARRHLLINLRDDTLRRGAFSELRPCLAIADGFYEWRKSGKERRPYLIRPRSGGLFLFAGLDEPTDSPKADLAFTVVTTAANADVAPLHDRMPALIAPDHPEEVAGWLTRRDLGLLSQAAEGTLALQEVSTRVNQVKNDDPACLAPPDPARTPAQRTFPF